MVPDPLEQDRSVSAEGVWIVHVHQWDMSCESHAVKYWWPGPQALTCTCNASNISRFSWDLLANNQFSHLWNMHSSLLCIPPAVPDYCWLYEKLWVLVHRPHFATYRHSAAVLSTRADNCSDSPVIKIKVIGQTVHLWEWRRTNKWTDATKCIISLLKLSLWYSVSFAPFVF